MPSETLRAFAESVLKDLCDRFPMGYVPELIWNGRLRVTAGIAYYRKGAIALSSKVLVTEEKLENTLKHEYAHLLAVHRHGRRGAGHGTPWRQAMKDLGIEPKVTHAYEVPRNKPRQAVSYECARCGVSFTRKRRLPQTRKYVHARCGGDLRLKSVVQVTEDQAAS
jgi:predicted SprT family Zn-dependent metalloprotease